MDVGKIWGKSESAYMKITPLLATSPKINSRFIRPYYDEAKRDVYFEICVMWTCGDFSHLPAYPCSWCVMCCPLQVTVVTGNLQLYSRLIESKRDYIFLSIHYIILFTLMRLSVLVGL